MVLLAKPGPRFRGVVWGTAIVVGASGSFAVTGSAEEIVFATFSAEQVAASYDFDQTPSSSDLDVAAVVGLTGRSDLDIMRDSLSERMPDGTQFVSDTRGVSARPINGDARFLAAKIPLSGDENEGFYVTLGFGKDREMKDASDRRLANKVVAGFRYPMGEQGEAFAEYRQVRGFDWKGVSAPEHQISVGFTLNF
ncbi:MAG: hypothetical protein KTR21_08795 [Rhodobacteraceae bacterium]|nr:hypothetical protein [Paracoccaceae bacterium]